MSDYFNQGDNGTLEKLKALMQEKQAAGQVPQMAPVTPPPAPPAPESPGISPEQMQELEEQKQMMDQDSPEPVSLNGSPDDKLLAMIRASLARSRG